MIKIEGIRGKEHWAGPGMTAIDCEMEVTAFNEEKNCDETYFIHANYFNGVFFTVAKESFYDNMVGDAEFEEVEFLEQYESLCDAAESRFFNCFYHLNLFASNLYTDFERADIRNQIKTIDSGSEAEILEDDLFATKAFNEFQYKGEKYTAEVSMKVFVADMCANVPATESVEITLTDKNDAEIERYDDIELAAKSKYFLVFCDLWKKFINTIREFKENADEETLKKINESVDLPELED